MNESLALSPTTASGELDTDPGHVDAAGKLQGAGPSYRHKRVCIPGRNCLYEYMIHRYTCLQYFVVHDLTRACIEPDHVGVK